MSMSTYTCVIIDDEPLAIDLLESFVKKIPFLELKGTFRNALDALGFLQSNSIDLLFLDIEMPEINGMDFYKSLSIKPKLIFTTAYANYAVESYDLNAIDYLLKPIAFERFLKAVNKLKADSVKLETSQEEKEIHLKSGSKKFKVCAVDIFYIESMGNYLNFHMKDQKYTVLMSMKQALEILTQDIFIRIHKSYTININHIEVYSNQSIRIKNIDLPIGTYYKEGFNKKMS